MRGRVLAFFISENVGYISGDDGKRYTFIGQEWKEQRVPQKGDYVDFDIDASDNAAQIFFLSAVSTSCNILSVEEREKHRERLLIEKKYTMKDWCNKCLKNYTTISGRSRRAELWSFYLCQFGILFALFVVSMIAMVLATSSSVAFFGIFTVIALIAFFIVYVALLLPTIAVGGRRLHDISMSAWWLLLYFIPCGGFILLICFCINTDPKENQWGLPAK